MKAKFALVFATALALLVTGFAPQVMAAQSQPAAQLQTTDTYRINPGDELNVQVFGEPTLTQTVTVLDDGTVEYPLIGRVAVGGKTPAQASDAIKTALTKYVRHPIVTVALSQQGQSNVLVLGNVKTPGKYMVRSGARLSDAIAAAGGLGNTNGNYPEARVTEADGQNREVSLQQLLVDGKSNLNLPLSNNAIVYVLGPLPIQVEVLGAVDHPGYYQVHQGDRLSMAIAQAGTSVNSKADLNHVFVTREVNGKPEKQEVNMYNALKGGDFKNSDPALQKDDVVYVPQAKQPNLFNPLYLLENLIGVAPKL
jgi:polysaccharide export outer membrane protein